MPRIKREMMMEDILRVTTSVRESCRGFGATNGMVKVEKDLNVYT